MNAPIIDTPIRLTLTRSFDVPAQRLFDAWLSESFGDWLGMDGMACLSCQIDPRVGGHWRTMHRLQDGSVVDHAGVYKEISRPARLAFTWSGGCGGPDITLVTVTFKANGAGTEMTLTHEGFIAVEDAERHETGWSGTLHRLSGYLMAAAR